MSQFTPAARVRQHRGKECLQDRWPSRTFAAVGCRIRNMSSQGVQTDKIESGPQPDRALLIAAEKVRIQDRKSVV